MNLALYREFRPKNFDDVIGQDYIVQTLKNQIKTNRVTHAYLFCGPRGTGKTSCAKIFAKAVNCTNSQDGSFCGKCAECVALGEINTDITEIDAASNNRVEEIRDLREKIVFPPIIGKYKVYIVDEVHMLTDSAFNALLKTLEEPPKHVIFILATTEIHKLPATILSRCSRFDFKLLQVNALVEHLRRVFNAKGISYDEKSLYMIAKAGEGSVRDSLSIADSVAAYTNGNISFDKAEQVIGLSSRDNIKNILSAISRNDLLTLFLSIKNALGRGKNISVLCKEMADYIKTLIMVKAGVNDVAVLDILPGEYAEYSEIAGSLDMNYLKDAFSRFAQVELELKYSLNPENLFESASLGLISEKKTDNLTRTVENTVMAANNKQIIAENNIEKIEEKEQSLVEKVWGNVLLKVREKNLFALSNALINVNKVEEIGGRFVIKTNDKGSFELIDNPDRIKVLLELIKLFDDSIREVVIEYDSDNVGLQDIKDNLKEAFKNKIKFKE